MGPHYPNQNLYTCTNIPHAGMQLRDCDRLLREQAQRRIKLQEELQSSKLIQMAKLQARIDQHKERLTKEREMSKQLQDKKKTMEQKILE